MLENFIRRGFSGTWLGLNHDNRNEDGSLSHTTLYMAHRVDEYDDLLRDYDRGVLPRNASLYTASYLSDVVRPRYDWEKFDQDPFDYSLFTDFTGVFLSDVDNLCDQQRLLVPLTTRAIVSNADRFAYDLYRRRYRVRYEGMTIFEIVHGIAHFNRYLANYMMYRIISYFYNQFSYAMWPVFWRDLERDNHPYGCVIFNNHECASYQFLQKGSPLRQAPTYQVMKKLRLNLHYVVEPADIFLFLELAPRCLMNNPMKGICLDPDALMDGSGQNRETVIDALHTLRHRDLFEIFMIKYSFSNLIWFNDFIILLLGCMVIMYH